MTQPIPSEQVEVPEEAVDRALAVSYIPARRREHRNGMRKALQAAAPVLCAQERERRDQQWRTALSDHLLAGGTPAELAALRKPDKVQVALFGRLEDVSEALTTLDKETD